MSESDRDFQWQQKCCIHCGKPFKTKAEEEVETEEDWKGRREALLKRRSDGERLLADAIAALPRNPQTDEFEQSGVPKANRKCGNCHYCQYEPTIDKFLCVLEPLWTAVAPYRLGCQSWEQG